MNSDAAPDSPAPDAPKTARPRAAAKPKAKLTIQLEDNGDVVLTPGNATPVVGGNYRDGRLIVKEPQWLAKMLRYLADEDLEVHEVAAAGPPLTAPAPSPAAAEAAQTGRAKFFDYTPPPGAPPPPKRSKRFGDKTPAFVEYLFKHDREEFNRRFGVIGEGKVTKQRIEYEPITGRPRSIPYQQEALLSKRKTTLTEKPDASEDDEA